MNTDLAKDLGLEFPIFAFTHCRDVAAAVSKAGGLGVLGVAGHSAKERGAELDWIENEVGDKPYGVDLLLPARFAGSDRGGFDEKELDARIPEAHRDFLDTLLERHQVPALPPGTKLPREFAVGSERQSDVIDIIFQHRIALIASALGPPPPWMIEMGRQRAIGGDYRPAVIQQRCLPCPQIQHWLYGDDHPWSQQGAFARLTEIWDGRFLMQCAPYAMPHIFLDHPITTGIRKILNRCRYIAHAVSRSGLFNACSRLSIVVSMRRSTSGVT